MSTIFREKNIKKINSPEELDKYVKTTSPKVWIILTSIIIFLIGVVVWEIFGQIVTKDEIACQVYQNQLNCYIPEEIYNKVTEESYIIVEKTEYKNINYIGPELSQGSVPILKAAGIEDGDWFYVISCPINKNDGYYSGTLIFEKITPISFIFN